ncbi:hypothetical protein Glove_77g26 [Diversispora epigaea]|uniref:YTH domain-containing protein n=1 Tax=Diversispora epigaea TaxID=1348612 RepID=A0A397JFK1_9GLOM|nr:hypothetical protein Glove_77g26 [Diversispora epigaea]
MSCEELIEADSHQATSSNKESRESLSSCAAPKKAASPSLQQNEPSSTAESSQELKRRQNEINEKDILKSASTYPSASSRDNINKSNTSSTSIITALTNGVEDASNSQAEVTTINTINHVSDYDQNESVISRRQSINGNSQSTPSSSSPKSTNTSASTVNNNNSSYSNGINMKGSIYEDAPQMYPNPNAPFIPVPSQYFTPQFFSNNGQFFYDAQYRFGCPPPPPPPPPPPQSLPPPAQPTFVRSNVYPYPQIPVITSMHHPPPFHNHSPLIPSQSLPVRFNTPSVSGGDSGFSSRRSSLDHIRTPDFGSQHSSRIHQQKKPKQLDKALWVGNLPDSTTYEELRDFFADENMESVFLIKKSNCAFVNYKTHEAVIQAARKYNENDFKNIKLVCRPRKQTPGDLKLKSECLSSLISENTSPTTPSETGSTASSSTRSHRSSLPPRQRIRQPSASMSPASSVSSSKPLSHNRYFILKSLTQDDLDISVQSGLWATQPHNEAALNKAFKSVENVYLIFSANKSGEFYGYARMISPISKETTETIQWTPIDEAALAASSSRPPYGSDDKARSKKSQEEDNEECEDDVVPSRNWGTTFKVEWIKVQKLPFIRTRHLRNPWNANREVKISRDGTEVEPVVGERLLAEFRKSPPPSVPSPYVSLTGPLLTQPLNIDNQSVGDTQDRRASMSSQSSTPSLQTPLQPMMEPNFIPNNPPNLPSFFPPHYWHPQPMLVPQYSTAATPQNYSSNQQTWATSPKDSSRTQQTIQTATNGSGTSTMSPISLEQQQQQQYVEVIWAAVPQHHYPSTQYYSPNTNGTMVTQYQSQQYYRNNDEQYQVGSKSQEQINNNQENDSTTRLMPYIIEDQRKSFEATSSA